MSLSNCLRMAKASQAKQSVVPICLQLWWWHNENRYSFVDVECFRAWKARGWNFQHFVILASSSITYHCHACTPFCGMDCPEVCRDHLIQYPSSHSRPPPQTYYTAVLSYRWLVTNKGRSLFRVFSWDYPIQDWKGQTCWVEGLKRYSLSNQLYILHSLRCVCVFHSLSNCRRALNKTIKLAFVNLLKVHHINIHSFL